jgi:hypothetical protein
LYNIEIASTSVSVSIETAPDVSFLIKNEAFANEKYIPMSSFSKRQNVLMLFISWYDNSQTLQQIAG